MMPRPDDRKEAMLQAVLDNDVDLQTEILSGGNDLPPPLPPGDETPRFGPMSDRVTRLEVQMEQVGRTLESIDGKLDKVNDRLLQLPTKSDLGGWKLQWTGLALAVVAIIIGGIIGGLAWIQPASPPTIITVPGARP